MTPKIKEIEKKSSWIRRKSSWTEKELWLWWYWIQRDKRCVRNLFDLSIKEDYYKLIRTRSVFNGNSVEYGSIGDKKKILTIKEYLDVIKPYLGDLINDYKTQDECKFS